MYPVLQANSSLDELENETVRNGPPGRRGLVGGEKQRIDIRRRRHRERAGGAATGSAAIAAELGVSFYIERQVLKHA